MRPGLVAATVLYAFVAILLAASLPTRVPLGFGTDLAADRWGSRAEFMLLVCAVGVLVIGVFAGLSARFGRLRADLQRLGAVTVTFLAVELALAYGGLGAYLASSSFGSPGAAAHYAETVLAGLRLSRWVVVLLGVYLAYVAGWTAKQLGAWPGRDRTTRGTADSVL